MKLRRDNKNSLWLAGQFLFSLALSFINLKLNLLSFGEKTFGIWIILLSIWGFGSALDFGLGTALVKFIAEKVDSKSEDISELLSTSFFYFVFAGIIIFIGLIVIANFIYLNNSDLIDVDSHQLFGIVILIQGLSFYVRYLSIFFRSVFEGLNNYVLTSKLNILYNLVVFTSVLIIFVFNLSIIFLAAMYFVSSIIVLLSYYLAYRTKLPNYNITYQNISFSQLKKISTFSLGIQGASVLGALIDPIIKYMIGFFQNADSVSSYEIARRFAIAISGLFFTSNKNLLPEASVLKSKNDYQDFLYSGAVRISKFGVAYSSFFFGVLVIAISFFIKYWYLNEEALMFFLILSLPESINTFGYSLYVFLIGIGKALFLTYVQLINVIIISVSLYLCFLFFGNSFGLLGYFITVLLVNILILLYVKRCTKFSIKKYLLISGFNKLLLLIVLIFLAILSYYGTEYNLFVILSLQSIVCITIFNRDYLNYARVIVKQIRDQYDQKISK